MRTIESTTTTTYELTRDDLIDALCASLGLQRSAVGQVSLDLLGRDGDDLVERIILKTEVVNGQGDAP